jgi:FAD/FMN-containing dehydrogenase
VREGGDVSDVPASDWRALDGAMTGEVILAGDERMILANKHYAAGRALPAAQALLRCRDPDDVRRTVEFVRAHDLPFAVRSGGHCFADLSSSAGAIIDLGEINSCRRDGDDVRIGPGLLAADLVPALAHIGRAFPTGGCPWVALGGFCLVGGFGFLGRRFGLATDRVRALQVLTAAGDLIECDAEQHAELFWAMRGAGAAGFGIVTALTLRTLPLPPFVICFGAWPMSEAVAVIDGWQHWSVDADSRTNIEAGLICPDDPDDDCLVKIYGIIVGDENEVRGDVARLHAALGPLADRLSVRRPAGQTAAGYLAGLIDHQGGVAWQPTRPYPGCGTQFTRSNFYAGRLTRASIDDCVRQFVDDRRYAQFRELEFIPWSGAYGSANPDAAFAHRTARLMVRHTAMVGTRADGALRDGACAWVEASRATLDRQADGHVYQGYADPTLGEWPHAYYGDSYARLQQVKRRYDPANVFRHAQSIGLPLPA